MIRSFILPQVKRSSNEMLLERSGPRVANTFGTVSKHVSILNLSLALLVLCIMVACATKNVTYYKPGGDQYKFNLDSEECSERAKMIAQSQMVSPDAKPDKGLVHKYYSDCLYAKGWSLIPLDQRDRPLWTWKGRNVSFEKFTMELPPDFLLRTESKWVLGPTWSHQLNAQDSKGMTFLILVAQESIKDKIQKMNYPKPGGFTLYTGGRLDKYDIRWSVFVRRYQENAVAVLGAYIYLEKTRRISVVFSQSLAATGREESGYALSLDQKKELDQLYPTWISWLKEQTGAKEREEKAGIRKYLRFLWEQ
jgi:hypothetical protein